MSTAALLEKFHHAAANPAEMKEKYLKEGKNRSGQLLCTGGNCPCHGICADGSLGRRYRN